MIDKINIQDVWKWIGANKDKIAINTDTNVLQVDKCIWCVKDGTLIIDAKEIE